MSIFRTKVVEKARNEELDFWERELSLQGDFGHILKKRIERASRKEEFPVTIFDAIVPRLQEKFPGQKPFKCIELGSGPLSNLAYGVDAGILDVVAVDSLAEEYARLYKKYGLLDYPIKPVRGDGESLSGLFAGGSFHCAYVRNALDHTQDIMLSFRNLVSLVMKDGYVVLQHTLREGSRQNWSDAHGWDLEMDSDGLIAINSTGEKFCLQKDAPVEFSLIYYSAVEMDRWMDVVFKKL